MPALGRCGSLAAVEACGPRLRRGVPGGLFYCRGLIFSRACHCFSVAPCCSMYRRIGESISWSNRAFCMSLETVTSVLRSFCSMCAHFDIRTLTSTVGPATFRPAAETKLGGSLAVPQKLWDRSGGRSLAAQQPQNGDVYFVSIFVTLHRFSLHV